MTFLILELISNFILFHLGLLSFLRVISKNNLFMNVWENMKVEGENPPIANYGFDT